MVIVAVPFYVAGSSATSPDREYSDTRACLVDGHKRTGVNGFAMRLQRSQDEGAHRGG